MNPNYLEENYDLKFYIVFQTSLGEQSTATPAGKATAEDPRRVVFPSVAEALPAESVRTERSQTVIKAVSLNSSSSQSMLTVIILLSIWIMFLHFI